MEVDPIASMRIWAIEIQLGGWTFQVPALPASHWLPILLDGNPLGVLDLIESTGVDNSVDDLILNGEVNATQLVETLILAVEQAAGRSFQAAFVLAQVARSQWPRVNGTLSERGFRWEESSLGAALDAIHEVVTRHLKREDMVKFNALLDAPLKLGGLHRRSAARAKAMSEFEAMAGPKPVGVPATDSPSGSAHPRTRRQRQPPRQGV